MDGNSVAKFEVLTAMTDSDLLLVGKPLKMNSQLVNRKTVPIFYLTRICGIRNEMRLRFAV
jgi:hypothetical protein